MRSSCNEKEESSVGMLPGLFDGFFGTDSWGEAAEMAQEMCILDEMEREETGLDYNWMNDDDEIY